jgi:predicted kinase
MKKGLLIIFSGLPGSGKSTLATRLATHLSATYLRIDTIEQGIRDICEISQVDGKGYCLAYRIAQENLRLKNVVIADSVNPLNLTRKEWNQVAEAVGAPYIDLEITCSNQEEHKKRIETRMASVPNLKPLSWQDVQERHYESWIQNRLTLDTSGKSEDTSFKELIQLLKNHIE